MYDLRISADLFIARVWSKKFLGRKEKSLGVHHITFCSRRLGSRLNRQPRQPSESFDCWRENAVSVWVNDHCWRANVPRCCFAHMRVSLRMGQLCANYLDCQWIDGACVGTIQKKAKALKFLKDGHLARSKEEEWPVRYTSEFHSTVWCVHGEWVTWWLLGKMDMDTVVNSTTFKKTKPSGVKVFSLWWSTYFGKKEYGYGG